MFHFAPEFGVGDRHQRDGKELKRMEYGNEKSEGGQQVHELRH